MTSGFRFAWFCHSSSTNSGFAINHGVYNRIFHHIHGLTVKINRYFNILELLIE